MENAFEINSVGEILCNLRKKTKLTQADVALNVVAFQNGYIANTRRI